MELQPPDKFACFMFYALALQGMPPHLADGLDHWYESGFCTCRDDVENGRLAGAYSRLVGGDRLREEYYKELGVPCKRRGPAPSNICSFGDIWYAWLHGSLGTFIVKDGIEFNKDIPSTTESRSICLPEFIAYRMGDESRPSVWRLNHYLRLTSETDTTLDMDEYDGMKEALVEYGFDAKIHAKTKILWAEF